MKKILIGLTLLMSVTVFAEKRIITCSNTAITVHSENIIGGEFTVTPSKGIQHKLTIKLEGGADSIFWATSDTSQEQLFAGGIMHNASSLTMFPGGNKAMLSFEGDIYPLVCDKKWSTELSKWLEEWHQREKRWSW